MTGLQGRTYATRERQSISGGRFPGER